MVCEMVKKKIVWEKWIDPLNTNIDEVEYPGHSDPELNQDRPIEFLSLEPGIEEKLDHYEEDEPSRGIEYNPIRIVSTPHGFLSLTEHSFASKHFDFWTLHYNHDITVEVANVIEKCIGVETVNVITRYRARIGFNRPLIQSGAFNLNSLRKNIENNILKCDVKIEALRKISRKNEPKQKNNK